jgi:tight adherence protein B
MGTALGLLFGAGLALAISSFNLALPRKITAPKRAAQQYSFAPFIDDMASAVRAGLAAPEAMWQASLRLPSSYAVIFDEAKVLWQARGFIASLQFLRSSCTDRDVLQLVEVLTVVQTTGSETLATALSQLARMARARQELLNEVRGRQAVTVTAARVAVAAPWLVLLLTSGRPQTRATFLSLSGAMVLVAVAALCAVSFFMMRRLSRIEELDYAT